jgi:hypothetical protein
MGAIGGPIVAVATDVGAWRVLRPVIRELRRRGEQVLVMLAEPASAFATSDGVEHKALAQPSLDERVAAVRAASPTALLLGTSPSPDVVERALARWARGRIPTIGVLDAMLFVERRFGPGLDDLADLTACPDVETAERLRRAGASPERLAVTGNPVLEGIVPKAASAAGAARDGPPNGHWIDVLFVSQPVGQVGRPGDPFAIDERESLADLLAALGSLRHLAPSGYLVRVRWHPTQRPDELPRSSVPPGTRIVADDDPDRLRSAARARVVVGISSTLLTEARMLPRAAVAYLPGPYWERELVYAPHQGVRLARSSDGLHSYLVEALTVEPEPAPLAWHAGAARRVADLVHVRAHPGTPG